MMGPQLQVFAQVSAERILNSLPEGLAIAALAWAALRVAGQANSGTRFAVWFSALMAMAGLPLFDSLTANRSLAVAPSVPAEIVMPAHWALFIFALWAVIALAALVRVAAGLWHLRGLRRSCIPFEAGNFDPAILETLGKFNPARKVTVCTSESVRVPAAIGFVKPIIIIPVWAVHELSARELNAIVLHELAHLRRWDDWTNLVQKIVRALLFFHPAVWWIEKRLALEREMACDDAVLAETASPHAYAECLVSLAEKSLVRRGLAMAQAAVSRMRETSLRVARILDVNRPGTSRVWKPALGMASAFLMIGMLAMAHAPLLIGFDSGKPASAEEYSAAVSAPHFPTPAVIPAGMRSGEKPILGTRKKVSARDNNFGRAITARSKINAQHEPLTVRASVERRLVPAAQMLVFIQTARYDGKNSLVWSITVWRVSVVDPVPDKVGKGIWPRQSRPIFLRVSTKSLVVNQKENKDEDVE